MKKFLIAGNWKMNKSIAEAKLFADQLKGENIVYPERLAVIAPFTQLETLKIELDGTGIKVGAQNVHFEKSGAYTGEVSVSMLKELDIDLCIVGHSERREYFKESDEFINQKVKAVLEIGMKPILCIGEKLEEREGGKTLQVLAKQIKGGLVDLSKEEAEKVIIAYEPVWAIGTGKTATPEMAEETHKAIRNVLTEMFGKDVADKMIIQYGGSMKPENAKDLLSQEDIDGGLVGGASLKADSFFEIIKAGN